MEYIGIDVGRHTTKAVGDNGIVYTFPSKVGSARDLRLDSNLDYLVNIEDTDYFVGWLAEEARDKREMASASKLHDETRILFLTAFCLASNRGSLNNPLVTVGLPIAQRTPENKTKLQELLNGVWEVQVGDKPAKLFTNNNDLVIVAEGVGAWFDLLLDNQGRIKNESLLEVPVIRILDLGSRMFNYCTILKGRVHDLDSGSLNYGYMEMEHGDIAAEALARRLFADLTKRISSLNRNDMVILCGGGAYNMKEALGQYFSQLKLVDDPVTTNAKGYRKLGIVYANQKGNLL